MSATQSANYVNG